MDFCSWHKQGIKLNYYEVKNQLQPLVLIHAQGDDATSFENIRKQLSVNYHAYSVDCYGHGESLHDAKQYNRGNWQGGYVQRPGNRVSTLHDHFLLGRAVREKEFMHIGHVVMVSLEKVGTERYLFIGICLWTKHQFFFKIVLT